MLRIMTRKFSKTFPKCCVTFSEDEIRCAPRMSDQSKVGSGRPASQFLETRFRFLKIHSPRKSCFCCDLVKTVKLRLSKNEFPETDS